MPLHTPLQPPDEGREDDGPAEDEQEDDGHGKRNRDGLDGDGGKAVACGPTTASGSAGLGGQSLGTSGIGSSSMYRLVGVGAAAAGGGTDLGRAAAAATAPSPQTAPPWMLLVGVPDSSVELRLGPGDAPNRPPTADRGGGAYGFRSGGCWWFVCRWWWCCWACRVVSTPDDAQCRSCCRGSDAAALKEEASDDVVVWPPTMLPLPPPALLGEYADVDADHDDAESPTPCPPSSCTCRLLLTGPRHTGQLAGPSTRRPGFLVRDSSVPNLSCQGRVDSAATYVLIA